MMQLLIGGVVGFILGYMVARRQFAEWWAVYVTAAHPLDEEVPERLAHLAHIETVHRIPVPSGWSVEQAWEAIRRDDPIPENGSVWADIAVDADSRMLTVLEVYEEDERSG